MYLSTFARQNKKLKCFLQLLAKRIVRHLHGDIISQVIDSKAKELWAHRIMLPRPTRNAHDREIKLVGWINELFG